MITPTKALATFGFLIGIAATASAQKLVATIPVPAGANYFAVSIAGLGDVDGDGIDDFGIVDPNFVPGFLWIIPSEGRVFVYSSATLAQTAVLAPLLGPEPGFGQGVQRIGDMNGDGIAEVFLRSSTGARVRSPFYGADLGTVNGSNIVNAWSIGDTTGDGTGDIAYKSTSSQSFGGLSDTFGTIHTQSFNVVDIDAGANSFVGGFSASGTSCYAPWSGIYCFPSPLPNVGRDARSLGSTRHIVGSTIGGQQQIRVYAGNALQWTHIGAWSSLSRVEDIDHDGQDDYAVSSSATSIALASGATGAVLLTLNPAPGDYVGAPIVFDVGDIDRDGFGDVALAPHAPTGGVRIHSGRDGLVLSTIVPPPGSPAFFPLLDRIGDRDGDGVDELAISAGAGQPVYIYDPVPAWASYFGAGAPADPLGTPKIGARGNPTANGSLTFTLEKPFAPGLGILLIGISDQMWGDYHLPFDLTPVGILGGFLYTAPDNLDFAYVAPFGGRGLAQYSYFFGPGLNLTGGQLFAQWAIDDLQGGALVSDAVRIVFP